MGDLCDADAYRQHPLFSRNRHALQIMFYYDDVEVCNPIGSRNKVHKLGMIIITIILIIVLGLFDYTFGNISPKHRSSLDAIQRVSVVKHSVVFDYGIDKILEPFIEDMKALESVRK